jgi:hypothetical protein
VSIILEEPTAGFLPAILNNINDYIFKIFNKVIFLFKKNDPKKKLNILYKYYTPQFTK